MVETATIAYEIKICARSIRALRSAGVKHFYISNLPLGRAAVTLSRILDQASR